MKWAKRWITAILLAPFGLLFASLLVPVRCGKIPVNNDLAHAENTAYNLKHAISAYFTEYREYPVLDPGQDITLDSDHRLMDILMGTEKVTATKRNPRNIAFFTGRVAKPMRGGGYRSGLSLDEQSSGELWDTWGKHYRIRFDTDGDNRIENPEAPGTLLPESIIVWSAGRDGNFDTWKDNVKTW